jgi:hypothetical protein
MTPCHLKNISNLQAERSGAVHSYDLTSIGS